MANQPARHRLTVAAAIGVAGLSATLTLAGCTGPSTTAHSPLARVVSAPATAAAHAAPVASAPASASPSAAAIPPAPTPTAETPAARLDAAIRGTLAAASAGMRVDLAEASNETGALGITCSSSYVRGASGTTVDEAHLSWRWAPESYYGRLPEVCQATGNRLYQDAFVMGRDAWTLSADDDAYDAGRLTSASAHSLADALLTSHRWSALELPGTKVKSAGKDTLLAEIPYDVSAESVPNPLDYSGREISGYVFGEEQKSVTLRAKVSIRDGRISTISLTAPGTNPQGQTNINKFATITYGPETITPPVAVTPGTKRSITSLSSLLTGE